MLKKSPKQFLLLFISLALFVTDRSARAASEEVEIESTTIRCSVCKKGPEARNPIFSVCVTNNGTPEFRHGSHQECALEWQGGLWPDSSDTDSSCCPHCPRSLVVTFDTIIALASINEIRKQEQEEQPMRCRICGMPAEHDSPLISVCTTREGHPEHTHGCHAHCIVARQESYEEDGRHLTCPGCNDAVTIHFGVIIAQARPQNSVSVPKVPVAPVVPPAHAKIDLSVEGAVEVGPVDEEQAAEEEREFIEVYNCPGCYVKVNASSIGAVCSKNSNHIFECHPDCKNIILGCPAGNCDGELTMSCNICWDNMKPCELFAPCDEAAHVFCRICLIEHTKAQHGQAVRAARLNADEESAQRIENEFTAPTCPMCRRALFDNETVVRCSQCNHLLPQELLQNNICGCSAE